MPLIKSELRRIAGALCSCRERWELPSQLIYLWRKQQDLGEWNLKEGLQSIDKKKREVTRDEPGGGKRIPSRGGKYDAGQTEVGMVVEDA